MLPGQSGAQKLNEDRLVYVQALLVGRMVRVRTSDTALYEGLFHSCSQDAEGGIVLQDAQEVLSSGSRGQTIPTLIMQKEHVQYLEALHVPTECELFGAPGSGRLHVSEPQAASHWAVAEYTEDPVTILDPTAICEKRREEAERVAREFQERSQGELEAFSGPASPPGRSDLLRKSRKDADSVFKEGSTGRGLNAMNLELPMSTLQRASVDAGPVQWQSLKQLKQLQTVQGAVATREALEEGLQPIGMWASPKPSEMVQIGKLQPRQFIELTKSINSLNLEPASTKAVPMEPSLEAYQEEERPEPSQQAEHMALESPKGEPSGFQRMPKPGGGTPSGQPLQPGQLPRAEERPRRVSKDAMPLSLSEELPQPLPVGQKKGGKLAEKGISRTNTPVGKGEPTGLLLQMKAGSTELPVDQEQGPLEPGLRQREEEKVPVFQCGLVQGRVTVSMLINRFLEQASKEVTVNSPVQWPQTLGTSYKNLLSQGAAVDPGLQNQAREAPEPHETVVGQQMRPNQQMRPLLPGPMPGSPGARNGPRPNFEERPANRDWQAQGQEHEAEGPKGPGAKREKRNRKAKDRREPTGATVPAPVATGPAGTSSACNMAPCQPCACAMMPGCCGGCCVMSGCPCPSGCDGNWPMEQLNSQGGACCGCGPCGGCGCCGANAGCGACGQLGQMGCGCGCGGCNACGKACGGCGNCQNACGSMCSGACGNSCGGCGTCGGCGNACGACSACGGNGCGCGNACGNGCGCLQGACGCGACTGCSGSCGGCGTCGGSCPGGCACGNGCGAGCQSGSCQGCNACACGGCGCSPCGCLPCGNAATGCIPCGTSGCLACSGCGCGNACGSNCAGGNCGCQALCGGCGCLPNNSCGFAGTPAGGAIAQNAQPVADNSGCGCACNFNNQQTMPLVGILPLQQGVPMNMPMALISTGGGLTAAPGQGGCFPTAYLMSQDSLGTPMNQ